MAQRGVPKIREQCKDHILITIWCALVQTTFDKLAGWMTEVQTDAHEVRTRETGLAEPCKTFTTMVVMSQFLHRLVATRGSPVRKDLW